MAVKVAQREGVIDALEEALAELRTLENSTRAELDSVRHERNLAHADLAANHARAEGLEAVVRRKSTNLTRARGEVRRLRAEVERPTGWRRLLR